MSGLNKPPDWYAVHARILEHLINDSGSEYERRTYQRQLLKLRKHVECRVDNFERLTNEIWLN